MADLSRRVLLTSATIGVAGLTTARASAQTPARRPGGYDGAAMAASISDKLFAGDGDGAPGRYPHGLELGERDLDRTLVLGGGGEYYVAWYCGFFHGFLEQGVDPNVAEMVVGTSAGAYAGSSLTSGEFQRLRRAFEFFGHFPGLFAKLAPVTAPNISQKRAQEINFSVKDGRPKSIRAIGHAALAADNKVNGNAVDRLAGLLTGDSRTDWPVAKMYTTANDCYTGERLVIGQEVARRNNIPLAHAVAASSSLPGVIGPTCSDSAIAWTVEFPGHGRTPTWSQARSGRW